MTEFTCPIQPEMDDILRKSQDVSAALAQLRQARRHCRTCPAYGTPQESTCPFWRDFNAQIRQAISEVIAELRK
jgi:hypothetical protein